MNQRYSFYLFELPKKNQFVTVFVIFEAQESIL